MPARKRYDLRALFEAGRIFDAGNLDGAILDMILHGEMATLVAERLRASGLHCVILSGYDAGAIPDTLQTWPRLKSP